MPPKTTQLVIDSISIHDWNAGFCLCLPGDGLRHPLEDEEVKRQHGEPVGQPPGPCGCQWAVTRSRVRPDSRGWMLNSSRPTPGAFMLNSRSSLRPSSTPRICQESSMSPSRSDPGWCVPGSGPGRRSGDPSIRAPPTARSCRSSAAHPQLLQHLPHHLGAARQSASPLAVRS